MESKVELVKQKSSLLQKFLDATKNIQEILNAPEEKEKVSKLQKNVAVRDAVIEEINRINKIIDQPGKSDDQFEVEREKHAWLWEKLFEQINELEEDNAAKMDALMKEYMSKVRSTKDSIRVIDAYAKQMVEESAANIDKNR